MNSAPSRPNLPLNGDASCVETEFDASSPFAHPGQAMDVTAWEPLLPVAEPDAHANSLAPVHQVFTRPAREGLAHWSASMSAKEDIVLKPGDFLGKFEITEEIGRGAMGIVYMALNVDLAEYVALKVMPRSVVEANPGLGDRFLREAQIMARIRHPNVVLVLDASRDAVTGLCYIVLELITGGSLGHWIDVHGKLPEKNVLTIAVEMAHALIAAAEHKVVHRDIKPDNIMLDAKGRAKLSDLGLAKISEAGNATLTHGGALMGTPAYMSPEQARDASTSDLRDDIYSLGASLYQALTGQLPFQGETVTNILSSVLMEPTPDPRVLLPGLSDATAAIIMKMMAKTRHDRYATPEELLADLQLAQKSEDGSAVGLQAEPFLHAETLQQKQAAEARSLGVALPPRQPRPPASPVLRPTMAQTAQFPGSVKAPDAATTRAAELPGNTDSGISSARQPSRYCAVLFLDIVNYTKASLETQYAWKERFNRLLGEALAMHAIAESNRIILDTGDGAAICFQVDSDPEDALSCAVTMQASLLQGGANELLAVRFGIHIGLVKFIEDINKKMNTIGDGINVAQRVMGFAGGNQLFISRTFHEALGSISGEYLNCCVYMGVRLDKHEREHEVWEFRAPELEPYLPPPDFNSQNASAGRRPGSSHPGSQAPTNFDPATLSIVERYLTNFVGPLSRHLVNRAAKETDDFGALIESLATHITSLEERRRFINEALRVGGGSPPTTTKIPQTSVSTIRPQGASPAPRRSINPVTSVSARGASINITASTASHRPASSIPPDAGAGLGMSEDELARVVARLAQFVGPLARVLVKRAAARATSRDEFLNILTEEIPGEDDQRRFLAGL